MFFYSFCVSQVADIADRAVFRLTSVELTTQAIIVISNKQLMIRKCISRATKIPCSPVYSHGFLRIYFCFFFCRCQKTKKIMERSETISQGIGLAAWWDHFIFYQTFKLIVQLILLAIIVSHKKTISTFAATERYFGNHSNK